jgi:hypothetical protein
MMTKFLPATAPLHHDGCLSGAGFLSDGTFSSVGYRFELVNT